jgi:hypothetical protein
VFISDYVLNGTFHGEVGQEFNQTIQVGSARVRFDWGMRRPFIDDRGQRAVIMNTGRMKFNNVKGVFEPERKKVLINHLIQRGIFHEVFNATSMRLRDWINMDRAVVRATRQRLTLVTTLETAVGFGGFDAMAKLTHEYEAMSDPGEAVVDMDGLTDGRNDSPQFVLRSVPLPITHSDFFFSQRRLAVSENSDTPLDTTMAEAGARRCAEMVERTAIGTVTGVRYGTQTTGYGTHQGNSQVYGLTNFPYRVVKIDLNAPTGSNPEAVKQDVIEMRETMYSNGFFGPFALFYSTGYDAYFDDDYFRSGATSSSPAATLRDRIMKINGIQSIQRLDYLTSGSQLIMVQLTPDVVQYVNGLDFVTMQWPTKGGLMQNFKILCIKVPVFKAPSNTVAGVIHGTTS